MNRNYLKFAVIFSVVMLIVGGGYAVWNRYFSEIGKARRFTEEQMKTYKNAERAYIEAMTTDIYGGKTPQETLELFIVALKKSDVDLASKYFLLDEDLSREKWVNLLNDIKSRGEISRLAGDISLKAKPGNLFSDEEFGFILYNSDGTVGLQIDMRLNKYSKVWKIESL